jgi:MFS superfamily sulfate permease-like transporter
MSLAGLVLGVINAAIVGAILLLIGAIILWFCRYISFAVPDMVQKLYIAIVALVVLYMIVALLFGLPHWRVIPA